MALGRRVMRTAAKRRAPRAVLIVASYPKRGAAERAARSLVKSRVVACATVVPGARAFYRWKGRSVAEASTLLWAKTTAAKARRAVAAIDAGHPDEVPEILVLPIAGGHGPYLAWLAGEVGERR